VPAAQQKIEKADWWRNTDVAGEDVAEVWTALAENLLEEKIG